MRGRRVLSGGPTVIGCCHHRVDPQSFAHLRRPHDQNRRSSNSQARQVYRQVAKPALRCRKPRWPWAPRRAATNTHSCYRWLSSLIRIPGSSAFCGTDLIRWCQKSSGELMVRVINFSVLVWHSFITGRRQNAVRGSCLVVALPSLTVLPQKLAFAFPPPVCADVCW